MGKGGIDRLLDRMGPALGPRLEGSEVSWTGSRRMAKWAPSLKACCWIATAATAERDRS